MNSKNVAIDSIKPNEENPRYIKEVKFEKLVASIKAFPQMLELRPIVVDEEMKILGGNMRHRAAVAAGLQVIPIIVATGLTDEQKTEFIIKDNVSFGDWDWDILANDFENDTLVDWGLDVWQKPNDVDYGILGDDDNSVLNDMAANVKRAVQIEFEAEHFEDAKILINKWREKGLYIGGFLMEKLKEQKE